MYVKYLAFMLRQNTQYRSLRICTELINVLLLADDAVVYLNHSPIQLKYAVTVLETFGSKSGCKVSLRKSCAFLLGSKQKNTVKLYSDKEPLYGLQCA